MLLLLLASPHIGSRIRVAISSHSPTAGPEPMGRHEAPITATRPQLQPHCGFVVTYVTPTRLILSEKSGAHDKPPFATFKSPDVLQS